MIHVDTVSVAHGPNVVFEDASFTIASKERCGLVGRNGSGKTTLLRLLASQESPDTGSITFSSGYRIGYLDQHIRFSQPTVVEEAVLGLPVEEREFVYKAEKMLFGLGFSEEHLSCPVDSLSGGFHLRLHLAKVLLSEPDCLLLDEPTNYLDILSLRFLTRFLQTWKSELLLVSHDREFMDAVATHTLGIHRHAIKKVRGTTSEYFSTLLLEEETYERTRQNLDKKRAHMQEFVDRLGAKASKAAQAQSRQKMIGRIPALEALTAIDDLDFVFREAPFHGKTVVEAKDVTFSYQAASTPLIKGFSMQIGRGERVGVIGKNGYGKSTLLRLLAGLASPQSGAITFSPNASIGYFGQTNILRLSESMTIEEEIALANPSLSFTEVKRICGLMMFSGALSEKRIGVLSGGEKSRVLLGKIVAKPCNLLLLDEPTHHLDIESVEALIDALEVFSGAIVIVTHSELLLRRLSLSALIVCHANRQQVSLGGYEEFLEKGGWEEERPAAKVVSVDRAEEKRKRAEFVTQRANALRPLKSEINRLETTIMALEVEQKTDYDLLEKGSFDSGDMEAIVKRVGKRAKEIESSCERLFELGEEYERKRNEEAVVRRD